MENIQPALIINSQYIKDLSLEIPHAPQIFAEVREQPAVKVDIAVHPTRLENNLYTVDLNVNLNGEVENKPLFILELTYAAAVTLNVPEEHLEAVLNIEIPRLIYPSARNVVTQCLMESGLPPIMLSPLDFAAIYQARKGSETQTVQPEEQKKASKKKK